MPQPTRLEYPVAIYHVMGRGEPQEAPSTSPSRLFPLLALTACCVLAPSTQGQTLYDGSQGTLPEAQGWSYAAVNLGILELATNGSALLDTTSTTMNSAGWGLVASPALNRFTGFSLLFSIKVNAETHNSANRAGFSCIALAGDTNGIELGFWTTKVFAQSESPLFTHAEDAPFTTTNGYVNYSLTLLGTNYLLRANGTPVLSGPTRNYTAFSGPINPYRTPNFLFFGDDTTSASGSFSLQSVQLVRPPTLSISSAGVISWTGVSNVTYTVYSSTNLTSWTSNATVTSTSDTFCYTNDLLPSARFLRVAYP
jgi:hypothetical protein